MRDPSEAAREAHARVQRQLENALLRELAAAGVQVAGGVPLRCGEGDDFHTFRVGLFGLDKLKDVAGAVGRFEAALRAALEL